MESTPSLGLPYPEEEDLPEVNTHLQNVAQALDQRTIPRYSNSATRSAGIPTPTNGQAAYRQDEEMLTFYKSGYANWMPLDRPRNYAVKTSDTGFTSSTLADDPHLRVIRYKASTLYTLRGWINFTGPASNDFKMQLEWGSAPDAAYSFWCFKRTETGGLFRQSSALVTSQLTASTQGGFNAQGYIEGIFLSSTASNFDVQFARVAGSGTTTVFAGSWIEIVEVF